MYNNFVAEGDKIAIELLSVQKFEIEGIFALPHWIEKNEPLLKRFSDRTIAINEAEMTQISMLKSTSPVYLLLKRNDEDVNLKLIESGHSFLVDGVQDPGNLGTIIRIADWFGFKAVLRTEDSVDFYNPKTVQSTMGSLGAIHLATVERQDISNVFSNIKLLGMDMNGAALANSKIAKGSIIVLGSEGKGLSNELKALLTDKISIPGHTTKIAESLNVAVSAGIVANHVHDQEND